MLASLFGFTRPVTLLAGLGATLPVVLLQRPAIRQRLRADVNALRAALPPLRGRPSAQVLVSAAFYTVVLFVAARIADRAVFVRSDGIYVGVDHNVGDLPFHLAVIKGFTLGNNFPPEHPELAGARLTYPFVADFVSALLVRAGTGIRTSLFLPTLVLAFALLGLMHRFMGRLTGDWRAALWAVAVFFLNGGLGFFLLVREADPRQGGLFGLLGRLSHDYTILFTGGLRWGNVITTLLVPQRSFLLGLPLALIVLTLVWEARRGSGSRRWIAAGAVAGLLPLVHAHSLAVTVGVAVCAAVLFGRVKDGLRFLAVAAAVAGPQLLWMVRGSSMRAQAFIGWHLGWDRGDMEPVTFWLLNAGLYIPLLVAALYWPGLPRDLRRFYLPFALCFAVPNVLRLSPWIWDNVKFLVFWHLGSAPLVALLLVKLAEGGRWRRITAGAAVVTLTLAGGIDLWRVVSRQIAHRIFDIQMLGFADAVAAVTPPRSLILHAPRYNSALVTSGRRSLIGYPGHIWSQGLDAGRREDEIRIFYKGGAGAMEVTRRYGVGYALLGPQERELLEPNEYFLAHFPVVVEHGPYRLLKVQ